MLILGFPSNPDRAVRRAGRSSSASSRWRSEHDILRGARPGLCRHRASTAGRRLRSCRCRARATWRSSSSPCRRATTWPAGASASWSATRTGHRRWRASRATTTTAPSRRSRWPRSSRSKARRTACEEIRAKYQKRRDVLVQGPARGRLDGRDPKASMYIWAKIPEPYRAMGSLEFAKKLLADAKIAVSPGHRLRRLRRRPRALRADRERSTAPRQAVRGIKDMFRKDGLLERPRRAQDDRLRRARRMRDMHRREASGF